MPDAANNPWLVSDCDALLEARDILAGDATLNWSESTLISTWDGVTLGGTSFFHGHMHDATWHVRRDPVIPPVQEGSHPPGHNLPHSEGGVT